MKNVSLASYVMGCSAMLLKEMLLLFWGSFRDYDRVAQTVTEAQAAGVISVAGRSNESNSSPDEGPLRQTVQKINEQVTTEIRLSHTNLVSLDGQFDAPGPELEPKMDPTLSVPNSTTEQETQNFWSNAQDSIDSTTPGVGDNDSFDPHEMAASLQGDQGSDPFGDLFPEEKLRTVQTPSPFPGAEPSLSQSLPGTELHNRNVDPDASLKQLVKTDFAGELLASKVTAVNQQLGLSERVGRRRHYPKYGANRPSHHA